MAVYDGQRHEYAEADYETALDTFATGPNREWLLLCDTDTAGKWIESDTPADLEVWR